MGMKQERIRRKLENNPVVECSKIRNRYCPDLFSDFADTKNPGNQLLKRVKISTKGI